MSLLVWLPLNGNLKNKGCSNAVVTAVTTAGYSDGKLGKALSSGKIKIDAEYVSNIFNNTEMSICFWYNNNGATSSHPICGFSGNSDGDSGAVRSWDFFNYSTVNNFHWSMGTLGSGTLSNVIPNNTWVHFCITFKTGSLKIYINGEQSYSSTSSTSSFTFDKSYYISFGYTQMLNDFRIYDECLSKEQIHQISKGLVLHYPLNSGYGNENLMRMGGLDKNGATSMTYNSSTDTYTIVSPAGTNSWGYGVNIRSTSEISIPYGKSYRASVEVYVPTQHSFVVDINNNVANGTTAWAGNDNDNTSKRTSTSFTIPANTWKKISWGSENSNGNNTDKVAILPYDKLSLKTNSDTDSVTWYLRHPKIELGTSVTDWCPNPADALYKTLGYDTTTEYDTSGFGNDGIINNKPTSIGSGVIGNGCLKFNGNNQYISAGRGAMVKDAITINIWAYMDNWSNFGSSNMRIVSCTQGGGWNFEPKNGYLNFAVGVGTTTNNYMADFASQIKLADISSGWHMITGTFDGINKKIYFDGILKGTVSLTTKTPIFYNSTNGVFIAAEAGNDLRIAEGNYFNGKLNDFRIYSTALSAEDIKQLYQSKARIDKNGNVYCNQFIEINGEEELLTTQKMTFHQANSQGTITYETNGNEVINIITMDNTISSWKYLFNNAFDKTKIINHKLKLSFKYKTNVSTAYSMAVKMCKGDSTKPQTINIGSITLSTNWQEYNGIITFGNTYDNQGIYIHTGNFCGGNLYIKDLSLKIYENNNKTDFTKKSQIITGELSELDSNKTYVYKNSKIVTNQIIEN